MENLVSYKHETGVLFVEGFAEKFLFFLSSTKLSKVVQDIAFDALAPDRGIQVLLKSLFRPKKNSFSWASPQVLHKLTAVVGKVLPFEAFFWHLLFGGSFPSFAICNRQHSKLFWLVA